MTINDIQNGLKESFKRSRYPQKKKISQDEQNPEEEPNLHEESNNAQK